MYRAHATLCPFICLKIFIIKAKKGQSCLYLKNGFGIIKSVEQINLLKAILVVRGCLWLETQVKSMKMVKNE